MESINLAALSTAFSGIQLAIVVAGFIYIRVVKDDVGDLKKQSAVQQEAHAGLQKEIASVDKRLAHVMGRLRIDDVQ